MKSSVMLYIVLATGGALLAFALFATSYYLCVIRRRRPLPLSPLLAISLSLKRSHAKEEEEGEEGEEEEEDDCEDDCEEEGEARGSVKV